ncbi:MAG: antitermination protein NusB [Firmicutes bacterium]|nr:antitermination protein NusB [Bacillota bacterium]
MNRRKSRELAMKLLFQMTMNKEDYREVIGNLQENIEHYVKDVEEDIDLTDIDMEYITRILKGVEENRELIDSEIEKYLLNWKLNRLSKIDITIMRICTYEMLFEVDIPNSASLNEALELAKKYSDEKSASFINGVLDKIMKNK